MTSGYIFALCVLDACVTARHELKSEPGFEKHCEKSARFGRLGLLEDLARHIAFHEDAFPAGNNDQRDADRYMNVSAEDFVLFGFHVLRRDAITDDRKAQLRR